MRTKAQIEEQLQLAKDTLERLEAEKIKTIHKNPLRKIEYDIKYTNGQLNVLKWLLRGYK